MSLNRFLAFALFPCLTAGTTMAYTFPATEDISAGPDNHMVVIADLNNDRIDDFVISNGKSPASFYSVISNGDSTFQSPVEYTVDSYPVGIDIKDIDNDGDNDVAIVNGYSNRVDLFFNNGSGVFGTPQLVPATTSSDSKILLRDADGKNNLDFVLLDTSNQLLRSFIHDGTTYNQEASYPVLSSSRQMILADISNDGQLDVIVSNGVGSIEIFENNGVHFENGNTIAVGTLITDVDVADLNNDGKNDIVATDQSGAGIQILLAGEKGFEATFLAVGSQPSSIRLGDINNNGKIDAAIADTGNNKLHLMLGNGDGSFTFDSTSDVNSSPYDVDLGLLDGDNLTDIVVSSHGADAKLFKTNSATPPSTYSILATTDDDNQTTLQKVSLEESSENNTKIRFKMELAPNDEVVWSCSTDDKQVSIEPENFQHTFDPKDYTKGPGIALRAIDDTDIEGAHIVNLECEASSKDKNYDGIKLSLPLEIEDNDVAEPEIGFINEKYEKISEIDLDEDPSGNFKTELTLGVRPSFTKNVEISCLTESKNIAIDPSPFSYIFDPSKSEYTTNLTVYTIDDKDAEGTHKAEINCTAKSEDKNYDGLKTSLTVVITDNDKKSDIDKDGKTDDVDEDDDGDGIDDEIEKDAPNKGDGNNDGLIDREQASVTSFVNKVIKKKTTFALDNNQCKNINSIDIISEESLSVSDQSFDYPIGLWDVTIECVAPGDSVDVTIFLDAQYDTSQWIYRKHNRITKTFESMAGVSFNEVALGDDTVTTISYKITDGGPFDEDGLANGIIVDPAGPATVPTNVSVASTGGNPGSGRGRYPGQTRAEYQATQAYTGITNKHNFAAAYMFSLAQVALLNNGSAPAILSYFDQNGNERFKGYQAGKIPTRNFDLSTSKYITWRGNTRTSLETVLAKRNLPGGFHASAPELSIKEKRENLYKNNLKQKEALKSSAQVQITQLERSTDLLTLRARKNQKNNSRFKAVQRIQPTPYVRPEHPGWMPSNPETKRAPIMKKSRSTFFEKILEQN